ncbi:MAG: hypothetical protein HQM11_10090 [SAR324 cluster bacterium]|nr:hypothetical protein [SAR324 cluster bacterium]
MILKKKILYENLTDSMNEGVKSVLDELNDIFYNRLNFLTGSFKETDKYILESRNYLMKSINSLQEEYSEIIDENNE